jgi:hypothetical protein
VALVPPHPASANVPTIATAIAMPIPCRRFMAMTLSFVGGTRCPPDEVFRAKMKSR